MKIALTGGGSGGHITPLLAVADALKERDATNTIVYIGQTGDGLGDLPKQHAAVDEVYTVRAGKLRRYHGEGWRQLLDIQTVALNVRDMAYVLIGIYQSWRLLRRLRPDVIFIKGGFVGVPVGLAAAKLGIPYVTHDSDAIPGLANKIIARWAQRHAVALPPEQYPYPAEKTITTGIPLRQEFKHVTAARMREYRKTLGLPAHARVVFIIGGGLGSQRINDAVCEVLPHLLQEFPDLYVLQSVGRAHQSAIEAAYASSLATDTQHRVRVLGYIHDVYLYSGAADVIVSRAGATNLAEFAAQGKATIIVPSPFLAGGHQLKNAAYLADKGAVVSIPEQLLTRNPNQLARTVSELLRDDAARARLAATITEYAQPDATNLLANVIIEAAEA